MARCLVNVNVGYYRWVCFNEAIHQSRFMKNLKLSVVILKVLLRHSSKYQLYLDYQ